MGTRTGNPTWENSPSTASPLEATALQAIEDVLDDSPSNAEMVAALDERAPLDSPSFTGSPSAPTQAAGTDNTTIATTEFVTDAVAAAKGLYVGINNQTGTSYAPVLADRGKIVTLSNASPITVTLPSDATTAFPIGTQIDLVGIGAGLVTFVAGGGATVNGTPSLVTRAQFSAVSAIKRAANTWLLVGDLATP
jgi:hypothetical protein